MIRSLSDLMRVNLLEVFNEPDPARRATVIAENYADDVVWHEPDRIIRGRKHLERRAEELRAENPDWVFRLAGPASELDDVGHLGFHYGPADQIADGHRHGHRSHPRRRHHRALHDRHRLGPPRTNRSSTRAATPGAARATTRRSGPVPTVRSTRYTRRSSVVTRRTDLSTGCESDGGGGAVPPPLSGHCLVRQARVVLDEVFRWWVDVPSSTPTVHRALP